MRKIYSYLFILLGIAFGKNVNAQTCTTISYASFASGFTVPTGVTTMTVYVFGAGGGGGGGKTGTDWGNGGGGGGGGCQIGILTVVGGQAYTITGGTGGLAGAAGDNAGGAGGNTVFSGAGGTVTGNGGTGGNGSTDATTYDAAGGAGGSGSVAGGATNGGTFTGGTGSAGNDGSGVTGTGGGGAGSGGNGTSPASACGVTGTGGAGTYAGGTGGYNTNCSVGTNSSGSAGAAPGGGGSGADCWTTNTAGSAGGNGEVIICYCYPTATISGGAASVCAGASTAAFTGAPTGGTWSITNGTGSATVNSSTGVVTGVSAGSVTLKYTVAASGACAAVSTTYAITVVASPVVAAIGGGEASVCAGNSTPAFTDATGGGTWSSSSTGVATIAGTGIATGVSAGSTTISYAVTSGGCTTTQTYALTVTTGNPLVSSISGSSTADIGNPTTYSDITSGGTWSVTNGTGTATITSGGVLTGATAGTVTISYSVTNGCGTTTVTFPVTINTTCPSTCVTFNTAGTIVWTCPTGVTSVTVQCIGGGGAGGGAHNTNGSGGGGGGGEFAQSTVAVVAGNNYNVVVGAGGTGVSDANGGAGSSSTFNGASVVAAGGAGGSLGSGGNGAAGAGGTGGTGTTLFNGGAGSAGNDALYGGGGGGGGAGTSSVGGAGSSADGGGGLPGTGNTGYGGNGSATSDAAGSVGYAAGGGGGGGYMGANGSIAGGNGAQGEVTLCYTPPSVCSGTPVAGTANATTTSGTCAGYNTNIYLSGASSVCGLTYTWYSSTDNVNWVVQGFSTPSFYSVITETTWFYCVVTCAVSGLSANSSTVECTNTLVSNDQCTNATALTSGTAMAGTNACATTFNDPSTWCVAGLGYTMYNTVWYSYTTPASTGQMTVSITNTGTGGEIEYAGVGVYYGVCSDVQINMGCDAPDTKTGTPAVIAGCLLPSTTYYIMVFNTNTTGNAGTFSVTVTYAASSTVGNDCCVNATALTSGVGVAGTLAGATTSGDDPNPGCSYWSYWLTNNIGAEGNTAGLEGNATVWYTFTTGASVGNLAITVTKGTGIADAGVSIYNGSCGNFSEVGCNDQGGNPGANGNPSVTMTCVEPNTTYYIMVWDDDGDVGAFTIDATFTAGGTSAYNDLYANAATLTLGTTKSGETTSCASLETGESLACNTGYNEAETVDETVWYKFVATAAETFVQITLATGCQDSWGADVWDPSIIGTGSYQQDNNRYCGMITCQGMDNNGLNNYPILFDLCNCQIGNTYYVRVLNSYNGCGAAATFSILATNTNPGGTITNPCTAAGSPANYIASSLSSSGSGPIAECYLNGCLVPVGCPSCPTYSLNGATGKNQSNIVWNNYYSFTTAEGCSNDLEFQECVYTYSATSGGGGHGHHSTSTPICGNVGGNCDWISWELYTPSGQCITSGDFQTSVDASGSLGLPGVGCVTSYILQWTSENLNCTYLNYTPFTDNTGSSTCVLPVVLTRFTAELDETGNVGLTWTTASETNNSYFTLARSTDAQTFTNIGKVKGAGTTTYYSNYEFVDSTAKELDVNTLYYRLSQTDVNGNSNDFNVIEVNMKKNFSVSVYPNPSNGDFSLDFNSNMGQFVRVDLVDEMGATISSKLYMGSGGLQHQKISPPQSGMYILNITINGQLIHKKIIKL